VSPKFVNDLIKLRRVTGSLLPRPQGNGGGHGKLAGVTDWIDARVTAKGEITLDELVAELRPEHTKTSGKRSDGFANCSLTRNAITSSQQQAMRPINCNTL